MAKDDGIPIRSSKSRKRADDGVPVRSKKSNSNILLMAGGIAVALLILSCACGGIVLSQPNPVRMVPSIVRGEDTVGDLVEHFKKCGLKGEFHAKLAAFIGAKEGGSFEGEDFYVEIYRYDDISVAKSLEKSGDFKVKKVCRSGKIVLMISKGEDKVMSAFNKF